jgi:hypothetical protein
MGENRGFAGRLRTAFFAQTSMNQYYGAFEFDFKLTTALEHERRAYPSPQLEK